MYTTSAGKHAIHAAGLAVNQFNLTSAANIRTAVRPAKQAALAVKASSESTNWRTGYFTGMPIAIFQNWLYEQNRDWVFAEKTIAVLWCLEFPDARCDYAERHHYVASARTEYNAGRHQSEPPAIPSIAYDRDGQPLTKRIKRPSRPSARPVLLHTNPKDTGAEKEISSALRGSSDKALEQLEQGPTVKMGDLIAAEGREIPTSTGVYTIWLGTQLLYVGISWKDPRTTNNKNAKGVFGRLRTYYDGRRTNDFMRSLGDRFITPHLTSGEQTALAQGTLDLDSQTRTFARERLTIRAYACAGDEARRIESLIRKHGLPAAGLPLFNAVAQG